jgi:quercetin dioxygenase-like cupin family protein
MRLDHRTRYWALLGMLVVGAVGGLGAGALSRSAADEVKGASVSRASAYALPNLAGQKLTGVLVECAPGASSPPHHHTAKGSVVGYVLEGAIRSKVNDGSERVYHAGESWLEPPGAAHSVSANASPSAPARLLAVFVAEDGAELTTFDK